MPSSPYRGSPGEVYSRILKAFAAGGIRFAHRQVTVPGAPANVARGAAAGAVDDVVGAGA